MKKVLVIEDEENWQREFRRMLEGVGYGVKVVKSKRMAIKGLRKEERPDIAVIDMSLIPGDHKDRKGWEVMETANIPIVVVSGYLRPSEVEKLHREDLAGWFFDKNEFDEDEFLEAVEEAFDLSEAQKKARWRKIEREIERRFRSGD